MKSIVFTAPKQLEIRELEVPKPKRNEVLIETKSCGICTYEQRVYTGEKDKLYPYNGGHEMVGRIVELGEDVFPDVFPIGKKVVLKTYDSCGSCYYCRHGASNLCNHKIRLAAFDTVTQGVRFVTGFSNYFTIGIEAIYPVPEDMPWHKAIFAEPVACVCQSVEQGRIELGNDVVVIGGGVMGMLHVLVSKLKGARVILSEPDKARRELAKQLGADIVINPLEVNPVNLVKELTDGRGADVVFDTTPIPAVAQQSVDMCGPLGRVVIYSSQHPDVPVSISPNWLHSAQPIITGTVNPSNESFEQAVNLLTKNLIDVSKLFHKGFKIEQAVEAMETACRPDTFRCSIDFDLEGKE